MHEKLVIALGGNALQTKESDGSAESQLAVVRKTAEHLADISLRGYEMAIVHGNGPQVGRIVLAGETAKEVVPPMPFDVCGAMSQGYIGYHIQQSLKYALAARGRRIPVVALTTQVVVERSDPAFQNPTKPIGPFYTAEEAEKERTEKGWSFREEPGKGWRRVVPSPGPKRIVEMPAVKLLWDHAIVITCGGGGVPVAENEDGTLEEQVAADKLQILTEVEKVAIRFGKPDQQDLSHLSLRQAAEYAKNGEFGVGSMLPKVQAAMRFVRHDPEKEAIITSLDKCIEALEGKTGTHITFA